MARRLRVATALLALVGLLLAALGSGVVAAEEAVEIPPLTEVAQVDELAGDAAGSFRYYQVSYPGDEAEVSIRLRFWPSDPVMATAVGFNVYGPGSEARGEPRDQGAYLESTHVEDEATTLLVQVYNYAPATVSYEIVALGISAASVEEVEAVAPVDAVETPEDGDAETSEPAEALAGELVGSRAGAHALVPVTSSGGGEDITVTATFWPDDRSLTQAVGFNVYRPDGTRAAMGTPTGVHGQRIATFAAGVAGEYTVQVFNYQDGLTVAFSLEVGD